MRRPTGAASSSVNAARASPSEPSRTRVGVRSRNEPFKLAILAAPLVALIRAWRTYVIEFALRLVDEEVNVYRPHFQTECCAEVTDFSLSSF